MSKGTPVTCVRVPTRLMDQIHEYLEARSALTCASEWNVSDFIVVSIAEKLDKIRRGRKKTRRILEQTDIDDFMPAHLTLEAALEDMRKEGSA